MTNPEQRLIVTDLDGTLLHDCLLYTSDAADEL